MTDQKDASEKNSSTGILQDRILNNAFIATIATSAIYLIGITYYQTYSTILKIPYALHPKTTPDYFLYAFHAFMELFPAWLIESIKIKAVILILILFAIWVITNMFLDWIDTSAWNKRAKTRIPSAGLRRIGKAALIPSVILAIFFYAPLFCVIVMLLPVSIGEGMGRKAAERDLKITKHNCATIEKSYAYCSTIIQGDKEIATGYIMDASDKYVTIIEDGKTRSIPLEGKEIRQYDSLRTSADVSQRIPASSGSHPALPSR